MKKKAIEKIPYLTLPKISRKKNVEYIGVTAYKNVNHERHLFLEVYRNKKECRNVPVARIVLNKKDFGTYFPDQEEWNGGRIAINKWDNNGLIWREDERITKTNNILEEENILHTPEDLERIKKFTKVKLWGERPWWKYINRYQQNIRWQALRAAESRKYERRQQALKERMEATAKLPEKRILEYADSMIFHHKHYLYYKKHGRWATLACSACGGVTEGKWKAGDSYEAQFEHLIQEPRMGHTGICPLCGACGHYMQQGRVKSFYRESSYIFLGEKYKETGVVFRYVKVDKKFELQLICGEKEPEMYSSREVLEGVEIARVYFDGKKIQKDYHKHNPNIGKDFWDDCNLSGLANISISEALVMPETYKNLEGTILQYSAMKEYATAVCETYNPVDYAERYLQTPQIEMLVKLHMTKVVKLLIHYNYGIVRDIDATRPDLFLGIRKERVKLLMEHEGTVALLRILQAEKHMDQNWTEEQILKLVEIQADTQEIKTTLNYMSIQKLLNHIAKYAGCEYGTGCSRAEARLKQIAQTYFDYLGMRQQLGYDMTNTVYLFPRSLEAAHAKMVAESNKIEEDKRLQEVEEKYQNIKKHYRSLRKRFFYEDDDLQIRPARSAKEIVMEGRILHHCVGGNGYLGKHNMGQTYILMLRFRKEPDIPYITVEINPETLGIIQWYGAHDKKPDKENMQRWLDAYTTRLKCGNLAAGVKEGEKVTVPIAG